MISNRFRFHGHGSLKYLFRHGKNQRTKYLTLKYCTNPKREDYRVAVVVSKKVARSAVARNRIRRRLYEMVRTNSDGIPNIDIALIVHDERLADIDDSVIRSSLLPALDALRSV